MSLTQRFLPKYIYDQYKNVDRRLRRRPPLYTFVTILNTTLSVFFIKDDITFLLFLTTYIVSMQFFFIYAPSLWSRYVPMEILSVDSNSSGFHGSRKMVRRMSYLPLLSILSVWLVFIILLLLTIKSYSSLAELMVRRRKRKEIIEKSINSINQSGATVVAYISGMANVAYQINQWIPVLEELDQEVLILVRQRGVFRGMIPTKLPVVYARNMIHVETVLNIGAKVVLYPANPMHNVQAFRFYHLQHMFINHGESDKCVNQSKLLQAYDKLLLAGPLAHRRLLEAGIRLREGQVEYVGRPQTELVLNKVTEEQRIKENSLIRILYAPTWEGFVSLSDYTSVSNVGLKLLEDLASLENVQVVFKPHPYTGKRSKQTKNYLAEIFKFCADRNIEVADKLSSIHECMNRSDLLITDVSSVLNDYLYTGKPIVLCQNEVMMEIDMEGSFPSAKGCYIYNLNESIESVLAQIRHEDVKLVARNSIMIDSLGDDSMSYFERFNNVINESISDESDEKL